MEAHERLYHMILGYRVTQAISAAAVLGICDELAAQPLESSALAARVHANPASLHRLMKALAALGLLAEEDDGRFSVSQTGHFLRADVPGSLRSTAIGLTEDSWWRAWGEMGRAVTNGRVPYEMAHGKSVWQEMAEHDEVASRFNDFMSEQTRSFATQLVAQFDFSRARHVVDVGGGSGALIAEILEAQPEAQGTLFDLPSGLSGAPAYLRARGVESRCSVVGGSFFESVPSGADVYILRRILHDWPDDRAAQILSACRRAMAPGASLLVVDVILPERATDEPAALVKFLYDLHMFVLFGARERTEPEMRELLAACGFRVDDVLATEPAATVVAAAV